MHNDVIGIPFYTNIFHEMLLIACETVLFWPMKFRLRLAIINR